MNIQNFISAVLQQDAEALRTFFLKDAYINWHNTNEHFTVEEYVRANCEYPGDWTGEIEKIVQTQDTFVVAIHVCSADLKNSFHCTSFIKLDGDKIAYIDEYWGNDGEVPKWRQEKHIGTRIK